MIPRMSKGHSRFCARMASLAACGMFLNEMYFGGMKDEIDESNR